LTAGVTYDSMLDVPTPWVGYSTTTDTSAVTRGNYCTLNPLKISSSTTISAANLDSAASASSWNTVFGTQGVSSGKWYAEVTVLDVSSDYSTKRIGVGVAKVTSTEQSSYIGSGADGYGYFANATKYNNASSSSYGATYQTNDVIGIALDLDAGTLVFYKNNSTQGTAYSSLSGEFCFAVSHYGSGAKVSLNAGQRPLSYTPPSGFKTLCTTNLPTPTILNGAQYMNVVLWTGDGVDGRTITGVGFNPDLAWAKGRSNTGAHVLADSVRGTNANLYTNLTDAETNPTTGASGGGIGSVTTDGFVLEQGTTNMDLVNTSARTYVGWTWKAGGTSSSNTAGSITSTVSANTTAGFSVVTWAGNSTSGATIGHGLGVAPQMIITKSRSNASSWVVGIGGMSGFGVNDYLTMNTTSAKASSSTFYQAYGSSTFTVGVSAANEMNKTGNNYVTYCFAAVAGYSAFGSYTGNGSSDGTFVFLGFRPRYLCVKRTDSTQNWITMDTSRGPYNCNDPFLYPNLSNAEDPNAALDLLSNGFKWRSSALGGNDSGGTFIYMAFAENPFKYSNAR